MSTPPGRSAVGPQRGYARDAAPDPGSIIVVSCTRGFDAVESRDHTALARDAAAREIIAGVSSLGGEAGLKELAADVVVDLSALIQRLAAVQGRSAVEVADELFGD